MSHSRSTDYDQPHTQAGKPDSAAQSAEQSAREKQAADHRDQIRSMAHAVVQAMVTSHRNK
jgi:hypothetical protein